MVAAWAIVSAGTLLWSFAVALPADRLYVRKFWNTQFMPWQAGAAVPTELDRFRRLLVRLELPAALADSALDWIDSDSDLTSPGAAEDGYYRAQTPPTWPPNLPFTRVAELAAVKGFTAEAMLRLAPFVTALPAGAHTPVNVNTAPAEVLSAVIANLPLERAAALAAQPRNFISVAQFKASLSSGASVADLDLDVKSRFFLITVAARIGSARGFARALVQRDGAAWPRIVWQVVE